MISFRIPKQNKKPIKDQNDKPNTIKHDESYVTLYGYQQLLEDFQHVQIIHANADRQGFQKLTERLEQKYPCDINECVVFARHYRDRTAAEAAKNMYFWAKDITGKAVSIKNDKDIIFQQQCDKIHSYLLHSMLKFDANGERFDDPRAIIRRNKFLKQADGRSYSKNGQYSKANKDLKQKSERYIIKRASQIQDSQEIGRKQLKKYYNNLQIPLSDNDDKLEVEGQTEKPSQSLNLNLSETKSISAGADDDDDSDIHTSSDDDKNDGDMSDSDDYGLYPGIEEDKEWTAKIGKIANDSSSTKSEVYSLLVEHMGIFRWQALHGFHFDQSRATGQIHPTFDNIKQV